MIEFAIAFPVFLLFFMGLMEIGFITFGNALIDNMMNQAARQAMVGCQRNEFKDGVCDEAFAVTPEKIRKTIREKSYGLVNACDKEKFIISVAPLGFFNFVDPSTSSINLGQGNQLVVYYARYKWPIFTPVLKIREIFGTFMEHEYSTVLRNERFGNMGGQRSFDGSGTCN